MKYEDRIIYKCTACHKEIPYNSKDSVHAGTGDFCCKECAERWYNIPCKYKEDEEYCKQCLQSLIPIDWSNRLEYYPYTKETVTAWIQRRYNHES